MLTKTQNLQRLDAATAAVSSRLPFARLERLQLDEFDQRGYLPEFRTDDRQGLVFRHKATGARLLYSPRIGVFKIIED